MLSWQSPSTGSPIYACTYNKYAHVRVDSGGTRLYIEGVLTWSCGDTHHSPYRSLSIGSAHSSLSRSHPSGGRQLLLLTQCQVGVASCSTPSSQFRKIRSECGKDAHGLFLTVCLCVCLLLLVSRPNHSRASDLLLWDERSLFPSGSSGTNVSRTSLETWPEE